MGSVFALKLIKHKDMGYIKEPVGVDLNLSPMPFSDEDRQEISAIIAQYKSTGEIPKPARKLKSKRKNLLRLQRVRVHR